MSGRPVTNLWTYEETGHTDEASRLLKIIFKGTAVFDTPKPPRMIERILQIVGDMKAHGPVMETPESILYTLQ
jgi:adenine-specific DNA-methyltransferase